MNIKHYLSAFAALAMLAACSDYDPGMSDQAVDLTDAQIETIKEYSANFVQRYGEMDPNHTWGFGELAEVEEMGTRTMNTQANLWRSANNHDFYLDYVPGYPQPVDASVYSGKYFVQVDNNYTAMSYDEIKDHFGDTGYNPAGDVTDEEILYVSAWFRTHHDPTTETINLTNYFVQEISGDYDRAFYGTMTGEKTSAWKEVTDNTDAPEGATCGKWLEKTPKVTRTTVKTYDADGNLISEETTETPSSLEDGEPLGFEQSYLYAPKDQYETNATDHVLNFNWQRTNKMDNNNPTTTFSDVSRTITYVYNSNTHNFNLHNTNDNVRHDRYKIVRLQFNINGKDYDGYYLAFDYSFEKVLNPPTTQTQDLYNTASTEHEYVGKIETTTTVYAKHDYDGYYSNYIVKIIPGEGMPKLTKKRVGGRVMCEDLGETDDFDFNDIVFDVIYSCNAEMVDGNLVPVANSEGKYEWTGEITLRASGGTLPIYIENFDKGDQYEAHSTMGGTMMSESLWRPINVGTDLTKSPVTLPAKTITLSDPNATPDPSDINIIVGEEKAGKKISIPSPKYAQKFGDKIAPQKICVPIGTQWLKERKQIETGYPDFAEWVNEENGNYGFGKPNDWTKNKISSNLYNE